MVELKQNSSSSSSRPHFPDFRIFEGSSTEPSLSLYVPSGDKNINKQLFQADRQQDNHRTTAAAGAQALSLHTTASTALDPLLW
jgi:hypothetical protein